MHFTTTFYDGIPHIFNHTRQLVCTSQYFLYLRFYTPCIYIRLQFQFYRTHFCVDVYKRQIVERDLADNKDQVDVDVMIAKKEKVKVHKITIDGNTVLSLSLIHI